MLNVEWGILQQPCLYCKFEENLEWMVCLSVWICLSACVWIENIYIELMANLRFGCWIPVWHTFTKVKPGLQLGSFPKLPFWLLPGVVTLAISPARINTPSMQICVLPHAPNPAATSFTFIIAVINHFSGAHSCYKSIMEKMLTFSDSL